MTITPEYVVAAPASASSHLIGRRTRCRHVGATTWPWITAAYVSGLRNGGYTWIRTDHDDGSWGSHRSDLYVFIEATSMEYEDATVRELSGGFGTHPLLDMGEPVSVLSLAGPQFALFNL